MKNHLLLILGAFALLKSYVIVLLLEYMRDCFWKKQTRSLFFLSFFSCLIRFVLSKDLATDWGCNTHPRAICVA